MNQNEIKNPKDKSIEQPSMGNQKTPEMNDRDRLNDVLTMEKYLSDSFNTAAREASHEALHQDLMTILNETHRLQYELYQIMFQKGAYKLEAEDQSKLDQAYQQFNGYATQFPYSSGQNMPQ